MTKKERLLKAFANSGEPDRVPFQPGLDNVECVSLSGLNYREYEQQGHTMLGDLIAWSGKLGFDLYHYAAGIPEPNPPENVVVTVSRSEKQDVTIVGTTVETSHGSISQQRRHPFNGPAFSHNRFIKDIHRDWPRFKEYFGEKWLVDERYYDEYARVGNSGVVGITVHTPVDFWQEYRHNAPEQMIYDFLTEEKVMKEFNEWYRFHSLEYLKAVGLLDPKPDFVLIHGSNCSASLISPDIFKSFALPYIQEASSLLKEAGIMSMLHICGKSDEWLEMVADSDINIMDALERPPAGNVDLAKVKKLYGDRLCLKGNVSAVTMTNGTAEEVRSEVKRCIDAAAAGGGFMLDVGDSIGPGANIKNVQVFVETALKYGEY